MDSQQGHAYSSTSSKVEKQRNSKTSGGVSQMMMQQAPPPSSQQSGGYHQQRQFSNAGLNSSVDYDPGPVVYAAHKHGQVHQYKCKYPGCNQVWEWDWYYKFWGGDGG